MKFTIDTEEKIIIFKEPFKHSDIEDLFSYLKIDGIKEWKITMESEPVHLPISTPNHNTGDFTTYPYNHWGVYCSNDTANSFSYVD